MSFEIKNLGTGGSGRVDSIAVIGIGCRFPGGIHDPDSMWQALITGRDCISEIPQDRWNVDKFFHPKRGLAGKSATRWGGFVDDIDLFDAEFFNISRREAELMDPQQRMLLEVCWESLEDAGLVPASLRGMPVGVFMGGFTLEYMLMQLGATEYRVVEPHTATGSMMTLLANRLSYIFDFCGPSVAVDTACSSSLVALHLACNSLASGESQIAVAGGVSALLGPAFTIAESRAGMLSPTGRSRAFDSRADGYVRGEGAGIVVLKPLADAQAAGDHIYAVIRSTATNQDGHSEGLTVPNGEAQQALMRRACALAGVLPSDIDYVETHGTGTPVGDPIEANAIGSVVSQGRPAGRPCMIGSVKTNIGHTEAAAGVAGLIKTALVLANREVPPHLHLRSLNPKINAESLNLTIPSEPTALPEKAESFAAVNSFGFGGSNAHVILSALPRPEKTVAVIDEALVWSLPLSARHEDSLQRLAEKYADAIDRGGRLQDAALNDVCWNAAVRREHHPYRAWVSADCREGMIESLRDLAARPVDLHGARHHDVGEPPFVYVFSGMGPQWWGMGQGLYRDEPVFRATVDRLAREFEAQAGWSILGEMMASEEISRMAGTDVAQPANFILQVGLAELLAAWGIRPSAIVGHSAGEPAAALVAGCLSEKDAVTVILHRSRLQHTTAGQGKMLAVGLSGEKALAEIAALEDSTLSLAAVNSPNAVTVVGSAEGIERLQAKIEGQGGFARLLRVQVPFHSVFMEPLEAPMAEALSAIEPRRGQLPLYSTVTGKRIDGTQLNADYWYRNVRQPVLFAEAIEALGAEGYRHFIELAPHPVLMGSIKECAAEHKRAAQVAVMLRREKPELLQAFLGLGTIYCMGGQPDWSTFMKPAGWLRLPGYPWHHESYWYEPLLSRQYRTDPPPHPIVTRKLDTETPTWEIDLERASLAYMQDHCVQGLQVFPGAGYMEIAAFCARSLFGSMDVVAFKDVAFEQILDSSSDARVTFRISVDPQTYRFTLSSQPCNRPNDRWQVHCTGAFVTTNNPSIRRMDRDEVRIRCTREIPGDECYQTFEKLGLEYGPAFQGITTMWHRDNEALSRIDVPSMHDQGWDKYVIHPALLDFCFQTLAAALPAGDQEAAAVFPIRVTDARIYGPMPKKAWIHARIDGLDENYTIRGDIVMTDEQGNVLLEIRNCVARALSHAATSGMTIKPQRLFVPEWRMTAEVLPIVEQTAGLWILYGGPAALVGQLETEFAGRGHQARRVGIDDVEDVEGWERLLTELQGEVPIHGIIHLASCSTALAEEPSQEAIEKALHTGCILTLNLMQALARLTIRQKPKLWIVTRGTQPVVGGEIPDPFHAPVWGMARVFGQSEHIDLWGGCIDLAAKPEDGEAHHVVTECFGGDVEDMLAWRGGRRYVLRLTDRTEEIAMPSPPAFRPDATYLITGGFGALGIVIAKWMISRGARHIALAGRTRLPARRTWTSLAEDHSDAGKVAAVLELEALGAQVFAESFDVTDRNSVAAFLARLEEEARPPLRGIIHSAGVTHPRMLMETNAEEFLRGMPAKVQGAWNLHSLTRNKDLDFFILFSSLAAVIVSVGQGNYAAANTFLDALAHRRRAENLPALSINWGAWGDVGMAVQLDLLSFFERRGLYAMTSEQGCDALGRLMSGKVTQAIVSAIQWSTLAELSPLGATVPMFEELVMAEKLAEGRDGSEAERVNILEALNEAASAEERYELTLQHIRSLVCHVLRIEAAKLEDDENLNMRGMDSMMAIELKNRVEKSFQTVIAIVDLFKGTSIAEIAALIHQTLESKRAEERPVSDEAEQPQEALLSA